MAEFRVKKLGLICGGTGIAVMYPVPWILKIETNISSLKIVKKILSDPTDKTAVNLLFTNKTEEDILLRSELDAAASDPRIKVFYSLDKVRSFLEYRKFKMIKRRQLNGKDSLVMWQKRWYKKPCHLPVEIRLSGFLELKPWIRWFKDNLDNLIIPRIVHSVLEESFI